MKKCLTLGAVLLTAAALLAIAVTGPASGQVTKGKTRPLTTKQLMSGLVRPNCAALGGGLKESPADDEAWAKLATNAALLNEAGHLLMEDGRCPDKDWAGATKTLRECSSVVLAKIADKDADGAQAAFQALTKACAACHKGHKK
jgi:hypothetical protein